MKSLAAFLICACLFVQGAFAQGEIDEEDKIFFRSERSYGAVLSSLGLGGGYRYARRLDGFRKSIYSIEYAQLKHQKEGKLASANTRQIGGSFVYGKLNALGTIRTGLGIQKELFQKRDKGGISIRYYYHGGLSLGMQKPVYYSIDFGDSLGYVRSQWVGEEIHLSLYQVERKLPFYEGLRETKVVPGLYIKVGMSFEFSKNDAVFNAIELGLLFDAFYRKVPIMANELNHWFYPGFYMSYRFGRVVDTQFKTRLNKLDRTLQGN